VPQIIAELAGFGTLLILVGAGAAHKPAMPGPATATASPERSLISSC
jgi:hypothetical protein